MNTAILLDVVRGCKDIADEINDYLTINPNAITKDDYINKLKSVMNRLYGNYNEVEEDGEWMV